MLLVMFSRVYTLLWSRKDVAQMVTNGSATGGGQRVHELLDAPWVSELERSSPKFVEGLARVSDVIDTDGALPRTAKLLFIAAISAVKRDADLAERFLASSAVAGLPRAHAQGAGVGLLISRGIAPHELFTTALERTYSPHAGTTVPEQHEFGADVDSAYAYFKRYFGFVPDYVELLGERAGAALEGYSLMREAALAETPLPAMEMELLLCAVNAAEYEARFVGIHARGARRAGATEEQLVEAALTAMPFSGVASWLPAAEGIIASRDEE